MCVSCFIKIVFCLFFVSFPRGVQFKQLASYLFDSVGLK